MVGIFSQMPSLLRLPLLVLVLVLSHDSAMAAETTTDPSEVEALKVFASKLGISWWNFSVDPCSGLHGWNDSSRDKSSNLVQSSGIQCDCSNSSICHVTAITVISKNAPGEIAPEIGNFSYLYDLNLGQNVLTGTIPEEIGSLSQLQYFNVAINKLSGSLPRSIDKLKQVISMGFGSNNLAGSLPKEIGNMTSLLKLYMDACGLGGELPTELGNLKRLETLWMAYNDFNGTIPEFLGSLSNLVELKMFGNNFQGPIPESLGNLSVLTRLEIGDVSSGGVIPTSFNNLTGLKTLSLRNCGLSGSIPELGNLTSLQELDLSFNNLTGQIPASFGSFASLNNLFLGSNKLSGQVPTQIGSLESLQRLDVSFNNLSGSLPTWWNDSSLNVNMIQNRFDVTEKGVGLRCLLGMSNCSAVVDGKNFGFSINSGGVKVSSSTGTSFSNDSQPLTVSYYMNSAEGWAVSSVGYLDGGDSSVSSTTRTITGTSDPASIYQTARTAPSSLKYLGFGMKNGPYKVELHFAEINIDNNSDYSNIARRMFDVYIQGTRVLTGLNIQNEAKGSYKAIRKTYNVSVSNNVVEVHFFWRGKGTWGHGPMVSAIQVLPEYDTTGLVTETKSKDSKSLQIGVGVAVPLLFIIIVIGIFLYRRNRQNLKSLDEDIKNFEGKPNLFTYNEMKVATRGFASETKLGQGGFGAVYKGVLSDGTVVAIKQLSSISQQGTREFLNEVNLISAVQHRNLVKLHGCCLEGGHRILVYEFLENNSLDHTLLKSRMHFDWQTRFNIIVGVARGIAYLHEESMPRIVHRDIKASNVLLDKSLNPKIADFGLAKFFQDHETHISTRVAGTTGYLAPEYALWGQLTEKADVYSYGVLILEIVSGRDNLETNQPGKMVHLLGLTWQLYENGEALELLDKKVDVFSEEEVLRVIQVALLCAQTSASLRPKMSHVVSMLTGTAPVDVSSLRPGYFSAMEHGFLPNILASDALQQEPSQISSKEFGSQTTTSGTSAWSKDSSQA